MAARPNEPSMLDRDRDVFHRYYAEADVLSAELKQPLRDKIKPRARVKLPRDGHYRFKPADPFRFKGILSYKSGYTQVAGHPSSKVAGFTTLATSVLEGLNVLDVVTADRVVAQISTVHRVYGTGQVPSVTFLGTRFDNLRIGGHKIEVERSLDILGPRHDDDHSYFDDPNVQARISEQYERIATTDSLPEWAREQYPRDRSSLAGNGELTCSLIDRVAGAPGISFGHVIDLPHFGKIFLAELKVERERGTSKLNDAYKFRLTMIRLEMGCLAHGTARIVSLDSNGRGGKGGGA
jgi:hypothetical protein